MPLPGGITGRLSQCFPISGLSAPQNGPDGIGCGTGPGRVGVPVHGKRERRTGMSELVGDRVQVRSCRHQLSRVPVASIVEPHVPADEPFGNRPGRVLPPEPGDPVRIPGSQHRVREHVLGAQVGAGQQVALFDPPVPKQPSQGCVDGDGSPTEGYRWSVADGLDRPRVRRLAALATILVWNGDLKKMMSSVNPTSRGCDPSPTI